MDEWETPISMLCPYFVHTSYILRPYFVHTSSILRPYFVVKQVNSPGGRWVVLMEQILVETSLLRLSLYPFPMTNVSVPCCIISACKSLKILVLSPDSIWNGGAVSVTFLKLFLYIQRSSLFLLRISNNVTGDKRRPKYLCPMLRVYKLFLWLISTFPRWERSTCTATTEPSWKLKLCSLLAHMAPLTGSEPPTTLPCDWATVKNRLARCGCSL